MESIVSFKNIEHIKFGGDTSQGSKGIEGEEMVSGLNQYTLYEHMIFLINKKLNYNYDKDCHYPLSFIHSFFYTSTIHNS